MSAGTRDCVPCHGSPTGRGRSSNGERRPNYAGIDLSGVRSFQSANMTWDVIENARKITRMKIVLKGILTAEDAALAVERVLELLRIETRAAMQQCGVRSIKELNPNFVRQV
jgi:isopentenyl diphosphate isomerase/L-lactate dehydrogenase-like FMN-dependent dehydrogenase